MKIIYFAFAGTGFIVGMLIGSALSQFNSQPTPATSTGTILASTSAERPYAHVSGVAIGDASITLYLFAGDAFSASVSIPTSTNTLGDGAEKRAPQVSPCEYGIKIQNDIVNVCNASFDPNKINARLNALEAKLRRSN